MVARLLASCLIAAILCFFPLRSSASASVEALLVQAEAVRSSNPKQFAQLMRELVAAKAQATAKQREHIAYLSAYADAYAGRFDSGISSLRQLISATSDVQMRYRAGALLVNSYAVTRQFTEGLRQLESTLSLEDRVDDIELRLHGLGVAAVMYNQIGQHELALGYAEKMLSQTIDQRALCFAGQYKIEAQAELKILPADDASIVDVIDQCTRQHEQIVSNLARGALARKWASRGERSKAIAMLSRHLAEVEATGYPRLIGEIHSLLAELQFAEGNAAAAERYAQAAIAQRADMTHSLPLVVAYKTLYDIAQQRGDPVAALAHYRSYAEADKAYLNEVKTRELAYQLVRQETAQKTQQIDLLNRQNQVLQREQLVDRQVARNTQLLVVLLGLLVAGISYWAYKVKRVQMSLRRMAQTDALTGVNNRHHFTQQAERALAQSAHAGEPCALVMFDLDHFKAINDSYGHGTGDWVLQQVAQTCQNHCRQIDCLGRLGGEEFAILLQGTDLRAATRLAEDCRVRLSQIDSSGSGYSFVVTASFGVSATPSCGYDLAKLLSNADRMLYSAKRAGRNRVHTFTGELSGQSHLQVVTRTDASQVGNGSSSADHIENRTG